MPSDVRHDPPPPPPASFEADEPWRGPGPAILIAALFIIAIALRLWRLGDWGLEGDEIFTLRDSLHPRFNNPRPLLYFLNYFVVRPFLPLDEFGLRLLPALFGALAIPAFYAVNRRLVGARAALFGALLLAFNAYHVYQSQYARYWSLVFLLCAIYPYALYLAVRDRNGRALAVGLLTAILAVLAHPVSTLLVGGPALLLVTRLRREHLVQLWNQKVLRWAALLIVVLVVVVAVRYTPMLKGWIGAHDAPHVREHIRDPARPGLKQIAFLLAYAESLTFPVVLTGILGIWVLWKERDKPLALLLVCLGVFPAVFLVLLSLRTPISLQYLLPATPPLFIGAGVLLDRLSRFDWKLPRWTLPAVVTAIVLAAGAPTLISQYRDGRRWDFRGAATWLDAHLSSGDVVYSDQAKVFAHYLRGSEVSPLVADTAPLMQSVRVLSQPGRSGALWIVSPAPSHAFRTNLKQGGLIGWMYDNCQLRNTLGVGRLDFRQQYLQIYHCPPSAPKR